MLGLKFEGNTKLRVSRWGMLCGVFAMLVFVTGCPIPPAPTPCTEDADCTDDTLFCNGAEVCVDEVCDHAGSPCAEGEVCNEDTDVCEECGNEGQDPCDDANVCTDDACTDGQCVNTNNTAECDDGDACTEDDVCADGVCAGTEIDCDDDLVCVDGVCTDLCDGVDCSDGDLCTDDVCDPADGTCSNPTVVCDDGFECDPDTGDCVAIVDLCADVVCDTSDLCNPEECDPDTGECVATPVECVAGEVCVDGVCEPQAVCTVAADCDDGVFCNGPETCVDSFCAAGTNPCAEGETCDEDLQDCLIGGETFNFTTDIDDLPGTGGDDIFRGVSATTNATLSAGDAANGGAGNDQLVVFLTTADLGPGISMDNIEQVFAQNTSSTGRSVSVLGWTGVEELWSDNSLGTVTFTGMNSLMVVGLLDTDQDVSATFNNTALTGTNSVPVELGGAQNGADVVIGSTGSDGVETIVLNSSGTVANRIDGIDDGGENDFTTLTITGDQDLRIDGPIGTSVKTVNAAALTGAADVSVGGLTSFTFTGTDQDDTVRATNIGATDTIDGGAGTGDNLIVSGTFGTTTITGVEALTLQPTGATPSFDLTNATGITGVTVEPTVDITGVSASGLPPSTTITVDSAFLVGLGGTASAFTLETPGGSADSLGFAFTGNADVTVTGGGTTLTGFESASLTFNNNGTLTFAAGVGITDGGNTLKKVTLASTGAVNLTALAAGLTSSTAFNEIDASGVTGAFTTVVANIPVATVMTITSGGGNDAIFTGAGNTTVNSGAGNDGITGAAGADIINGGAGIDTITGGAANDTLDGGSEADTFVFGATAAANGADTINGFSATNDVLNLKAYDAAATAPTGTVADTSTGVLATADGDVYIVTDADGSIDTAGEVAGLFSAAGTPFAAGTASADVVLIIQDTQSGGSTTLWFVDNDATAAVIAGECVQVANLSGFNGTIADANLAD